MGTNKTMETRWATIEWTDDGILIFRYLAGCVLDAAVARHVVAAGVELCGGQAPAPVLACLDEVAGFTKDAREFFANSDDNVAASSHVALLVASPIARTIANFFLRLSKPRVPTRSFTEWDKAMSWLHQQKRLGQSNNRTG